MGGAAAIRDGLIGRLRTCLMTTPSDVLARKLRRFMNFTGEELRVLHRLDEPRRKVEAHTELTVEGQERQDCYILLEGWAACYKLLPDGKRQIINFSIPGDFLGLRSFLLRTADHSVVTLTQAWVSQFEQQRILEILEMLPRLGAAILWALSREEAIVVEHLVNIGRRKATGRVAHLLLELGERLRLVGLGNDGGYACPLTQEELADAVGLTPIHINRVLRQLRERGLATLSQRQLVIHDLAGLQELAEFNIGFLDYNGLKHKPE
jgi:CRP-like cAMP-binding protein